MDINESVHARNGFVAVTVALCELVLKRSSNAWHKKKNVYVFTYLFQTQYYCMEVVAILQKIK